MDSQQISILFFAVLIGGMALLAAYVYTLVRPGQLKVRLISETRVEQSFYVSIKQAFFLHGQRRYKIEAERIYHTGFFRTPIAIYKENNQRPLDLLTPSAVVTPSDITAAAAHDSIETHVARDVLNAFREELLTPEVTLGITLVVLLAGFGGLYYVLSEKLNEILRMVS